MYRHEINFIIQKITLTKLQTSCDIVVEIKYSFHKENVSWKIVVFKYRVNLNQKILSESHKKYQIRNEDFNNLSI